MIPLCVPQFGPEEVQAIRRILRSGWVAEGEENHRFEERFARTIGVDHAVTVNSGYSALQLAIQAAGLRGEIILPSFTFAASANAVVNAGCVPVFADILPDTLNIDPEQVRRRITSRTVGVMPVHYAGQSCDMDGLMRVSRGLTVIEDSAEAIGATHRGRRTGSFGIGCFSFFATKNITTGEGGMVTTRSARVARRVRLLKGHGIATSTWERAARRAPWRRSAVAPGYNYRMSSLQAAVGLVQLGRLDSMNRRRRSHARYLTRRLSGLEGIRTPAEDPRCRHVYQMYVIRVSVDRDRFVLALRKRGVGASVHFDPPVHLHPYYRRMRRSRGRFPVTESAARSVVTLPMYPQLRKRQLDAIVAAVEGALDEVKRRP